MHILSVETHLCILINIPYICIMLVLNVSMCINEPIFSFLPFIQCECINGYTNANIELCQLGDSTKYPP